MPLYIIYYIIAGVLFLACVLLYRFEKEMNFKELVAHLVIFFIASGLATQFIPEAWHVPYAVAYLMMFIILETVLAFIGLFFLFRST